MTKRVNWSSESARADMATRDEAFLPGGVIVTMRGQQGKADGVFIEFLFSSQPHGLSSLLQKLVTYFKTLFFLYLKDYYNLKNQKCQFL